MEVLKVTEEFILCRDNHGDYYGTYNVFDVVSYLHSKGYLTMLEVDEIDLNGIVLFHDNNDLSWALNEMYENHQYFFYKHFKKQNL